MKTFILAFITLFLIGCGSSGGDSAPSATTTTPPVVVLPVEITQQPTSMSGTVGSNLSFNIMATNVTEYHWQWSADGVTWIDPGPSFIKNEPSYTINNIDMSINGYWVHCIVSNSISTVTSNPAQITVLSTSPVVTQQPQDNYCVSGESAYLLIYSTNTTNYQWEYALSEAGPWSRNPGNRFALTQQSFNFVTRTLDNGMCFRCIVTNSATGESVTSNIAKIYVVAAVPQ